MHIFIYMKSEHRNQNLHVFILKLYKDEGKTFQSFSEILISNLAVNLPWMFWKMAKFENFITHVTKVKFEEKIMSILFPLEVSILVITPSDQDQEKVNIFLDNLMHSFFQAAVTSILLYGCTTWTLTKRLEKKLDGNYTRMLHAILNKSWQQHPTRHQLYGHLPPITKTIQVRRTRHAGHCWRSRDELIRDVLLWIPTHGRAKAGRPARTYIQQLCEDTGCCPEDLPRAMNDREEWRERVRDIRATSTRWWWWW